MKIFFFLLILNYTASGFSLDELRKEYPKAMVDKACCDKWYTILLNEKDENNALIMAYKGGIYMGMAKFAVVAKKVPYVNKGKALIEAAILKEKNNVEIRFVRYSVQAKLPPALGYNKNKEEDKTFITANIEQIKNERFRAEILKFLKEN